MTRVRTFYRTNCKKRHRNFLMSTMNSTTGSTRIWCDFIVDLWGASMTSEITMMTYHRLVEELWTLNQSMQFMEVFSIDDVENFELTSYQGQVMRVVLILPSNYVKIVVTYQMICQVGLR